MVVGFHSKLEVTLIVQVVRNVVQIIQKPKVTLSDINRQTLETQCTKYNILKYFDVSKSTLNESL